MIESDGDQKDYQVEKKPENKSVTSHIQTELNGHQKKNKTTQRVLTNIKRLVKSSKKLETLPKEYALKVIQYKLDFHKYCKNNSMYRRTTSIVPWKLMGKYVDI